MRKKLGTVLIIDDDPSSNFLSALTLRQANAVEQVFEAGDGSEALELVLKEPIDLILLDINMPGMNGFLFLDALQKLQEVAGFPVPVVVLLTTSENYLGSDSAAGYPLVKGLLTKPLMEEQVPYLIGLITDGKRADPAA